MPVRNNPQGAIASAVLKTEPVLNALLKLSSMKIGIPLDKCNDHE